jgi:hypothetical protein
MPTFDPTKPVANSQISSAELRDQLNALNDALTATTTTANNAFGPVNNWQANLSTLTQLTTTYTDPVSAADLNELRDKINLIIIDLTS